jgi:HTH-type transcriptional regulator/antitoxin HigA
MNKELTPARVFPPGRMLARELAARGWTQKELAQVMGRPEQTLSEIINATKRITEESARELAAALGTSPELWLSLESAYRLQQARDDEEERVIARRSRLYQLAPIGELVRRGWLSSSKDVTALERNVCAFLGMPSPDEEPPIMRRIQSGAGCASALNEPPPAAANFPHSVQRTPAMHALACWLRRVEQLAEDQDTPRFSASTLRRVLPRIKACAGSLRDVSRVPALLAEAGVRFVILKQLQKTYLDGATWADKQSAVVALTLRYDRIDSFWFTLLHELSHLLLADTRLCITRLDDRQLVERMANTAAECLLIDPAAFAEFAAAHAGRVGEHAIRCFAAKAEVHPGIVVGRLQHHGLVSWSYYRRLLEPVSPLLRAWQH